MCKEKLTREQLEAKFEEACGIKVDPHGIVAVFIIDSILEVQSNSLVGRRARHKQPCVQHGICNWSGFDEIDKVFIDADGIEWAVSVSLRDGEVNHLEFEDEPQSRFKVGDPVVFTGNKSVFTGHKSVYMVEQVRGEWVSFSPEGYPYAAFYHQDSLTLVCDHSFKCEKCGVAK